jgi:purine nucleosidase
MIFHDPLAGAVIFQPDICRYQRGEIAVELESTRLEGYTHWEPAMNGSKEIAVSVDSEAFFSHFFAPFQLSMEH